LALAEWALSGAQASLRISRRPCHDHPPAEIGMTLDEVDTPALVIDLDAFERMRSPVAHCCCKRLVDRPTMPGAPL
jgi:hypothetical protein